jgi:hypothetical protein
MDADGSVQDGRSFSHPYAGERVQGSGFETAHCDLRRFGWTTTNLWTANQNVKDFAH